VSRLDARGYFGSVEQRKKIETTVAVRGLEHDVCTPLATDSAVRVQQSTQRDVSRALDQYRHSARDDDHDRQRRPNVLQLVFSEEKHGRNQRGEGLSTSLPEDGVACPSRLPSSERIEADRAAVGLSYFFGIGLPVPVPELQ
jgi:hypothetical protein